MNEAEGSPSPAGLPASVAMAWGVQPPPPRGLRPGLTMDMIVAAAISIADESGLGALSMGAVADRVGYTTMSLYRYVTVKADLITLMADAALGLPPTLRTGPRLWRQAVERWAGAASAVYHRHPWCVDVPVTEPPSMPNRVAWLERLVATLAATGMTDREQWSTARLVDGCVRSNALFGRPGPAGGDGQLPQLSIEQLQVLLDDQRFPALNRLAAGGHLLSRGGTDAELTFALGRILDGVAALVAARKPPSRRAPASRSSKR